MIRINVQDEKTLALNRAVAATANAIRNRSVHDRNPAIGKMIKCQVCNRRHRNTIKCEQHYVIK